MVTGKQIWHLFLAFLATFVAAASLIIALQTGKIHMYVLGVAMAANAIFQYVDFYGCVKHRK